MLTKFDDIQCPLIETSVSAAEWVIWLALYDAMYVSGLYYKTNKLNFPELERTVASSYVLNTAMMNLMVMELRCLL
jgi:hypothetical protein